MEPAGESEPLNTSKTAVPVASLLNTRVPLFIRLPVTDNFFPAPMVKVLPELMVKSLHVKSVVVVKSPAMMASIVAVGALFDHEVV